MKSENVRNAAFLGVKNKSTARKPFVSAALRTAQVAHLTGKSTVLTWTEYQFQTDLDAGDFTQTGLKRVR